MARRPDVLPLLLPAPTPLVDRSQQPLAAMLVAPLKPGIAVPPAVTMMVAVAGDANNAPY